MLDERKIERLERATRTDPANLELYVLKADLAELLRVYRLVKDAPGIALSREQVDAWGLPETFVNEPVRLVADTQAKEGSDG